jgi:hypothetical protein
MRLVCFPHYTCGGLLCDLLNHKVSKTGKNGGVDSVQHNLGKIGDSDSVFCNYDVDQLMQRLATVKAQNWIGTHCWPGPLPLDKFDQIINITTATYRSRLYRWVRAYHLYYSHSEPWLSQHEQFRVDKERETAKNYLIAFDPVSHSQVINVEFSEIVEQQPSFMRLVNCHSDALRQWRSANSFLYSQDLWSSTAAARFHEAELETQLSTQYVYQSTVN